MTWADYGTESPLSVSETTDSSQTIIIHVDSIAETEVGTHFIKATITDVRLPDKKA